MNAKRLFAALILAAGGLALQAQDHPMEAPGFVPNKIYDLHDLDSVNTFNGNLIVSVPIGPTYHVNGNLSYGLALHYNSHAWHYWIDLDVGPDGQPPDPQCIIDTGDPHWRCYWASAEPSKRANAALGWSISLGRLWGPGDALNIISNKGSGWLSGFTYEDPDGATHAFPFDTDQCCERAGALLSRDGSYMRLREDSDLAHVYIDSRDGITRQFAKVTGGHTLWRLVKISDASGNHVDIAYSPDELTWTITDIARTITVQFAAGQPLFTKLVSVTLPPPTGTGPNVTYQFTTVMESFPQPYGVSSYNPPPLPISVPVLTAVTPPGGNPYRFTNSDGTPAYDGVSNIFTGCLQQMTVPTGAVHVWDYFEDSVRVGVGSPTVETPVEVMDRSITDPATGAVSAWHYDYAPGYGFNGPGNKRDQRERISTVTRPDQSREVHHYSLFSTGPFQDDLLQNWSYNDYGLPFVPSTDESILTWYAARSSGRHATSRPDPAQSGQTQYLSSEVFDAAGNLLQSHYVTYDGDTPRTGAELRPNARVSAEVVYAEDTTTVGGGVTPALPWVVNPPFGVNYTVGGPANIFSATHRYNYRSFGNYATTVTTGKGADGTLSSKTGFQNFPPQDAISIPTYAVDVPSGSCTADGNVTAPIDILLTTLDACAAFNNPFITLFDYDQQHVRLNGKRVLAASGLGPTDLLVHYVYGDAGDAQNSGSNGNLTAEAYEGGDGGNAGTGTSFPYSPVTSSSAGLTILRHVYSYTNGASGGISGLISRYDSHNWATSDFTIAAASGSILSSRDASGLQTGYSYDQLGRLKGVTPPGGSSTTYSYVESSIPVHIDAVTTAGGSILKQASYDYDGLGRLWHERSFVNGAWSTRTTQYDSLSRATGVSPLQAAVPNCLNPVAVPDIQHNPPNSICTETRYDALGRAAFVRSPDYFLTTITYAGNVWINRLQDLGNGQSASTTESNDGLGRLASVTDPVNTTGTYSYDAADHLTQAVVQAVGGDGASHTQQRSFAYDHRGFLTSESHPENGQFFYKYDQRGHMLNKGRATPGPFDLQFTYDTAERLLTVVANPSASQTQLMKSFQYAEADGSYTSAAYQNTTADYSSGKLVLATRHNYQAVGDVEVKEEYHYLDAAGRLSDRITSICVAPDPVHNPTVCNPTQKLTQSTTYNELGLTASTLYPTCTVGPGCLAPTWPSISRSYAEGRLTNVQSPLGAVAAITYSENEMLNTVVHGSGVNVVTDTIEKDDLNQLRPKSITVTGPTPSCTPPAWSPGGEPSNQNVQYGGSVTLQASATGSPALTYQWITGGVPVGTGPTFTTPALSATTTYTLNVSNGCGTNLTATITVTVSSCVTMSWAAEPVNQSVNAGTPVLLTASVNATGPVTYNWSVGSTTVNSTASWQPVITATTTYTLTVKDACNNPLTDTFTITACSPMSWQTPPTDLDVAPNSPFTLSVNVIGTAPLTYTWYIGSTPVSSLPTWQTMISANTTFTVVVRDACGTPLGAIINVYADGGCSTPTITTQPVADSGVFTQFQHVSPALFVTATGAGLSYQWNELDNDQGVLGASFAPVVTRSIAYHAIVSAGCGLQTTSAPAIVRVFLPPPANAAVSGSGNSATVTWTPLDGNLPVRQYEVWRDIGAGWGTLPLVTVSNLSNSWTDITLLSGQTAQYRVRAVETETYPDEQLTITNFSDYSATVTYTYICTLPQILTAPVTFPPQVARNTTLSPPLTVVASGGPLSYQWFEIGSPPPTPLSTTASFAPVVVRSGWYYVEVTNSCGSVTSPQLGVQVPVQITLALPAPANVVATAAAGGGNVTVQWSLLSGYPVDHFQILRTLSGVGGWGPVATVSGSTSSWTDTTLAAGQAAAYRVRAVEQVNYGSGGLLVNNGPLSNIDVATRFAFSSIPPNVSFAPLEQTRQAINAVQVAAGQPAQTWSNLVTQVPSSGGTVRAAEIKALRQALKSALSVFSITLPPFTDDDGAQGVPAGTAIKRIHITELQGRTQ